MEVSYYMTILFDTLAAFDQWPTAQSAAITAESVAISAGDLAQFVSAVATFVIAGVSAYGLRQQRMQMRNAVLPRLVPFGRSLATEALARTTTVLMGQGTPLELENVGNGAAVNVQWETRPQVSNTGVPTVVSRETTYLARVRAGERVRLSHSQPLEVAGWDLALWFDDMFGHHYYAAFRARGDQWYEVDKQRECKRPKPLFAPSPF
jgi:hypothetical protein